MWGLYHEHEKTEALALSDIIRNTTSRNCIIQAAPLDLYDWPEEVRLLVHRINVLVELWRHRVQVKG